MQKIIKINIENYLSSEDADKFMEDLLIQSPKTKKITDLVKLFFSGGFREHQWMDDEKSLIRLLLSCSFNNAISLAPGETNISNENDLNLYERKNESVYIEGIK